MVRKSYQVLNEITVSSTALLKNYQYFANKNPGCLIAPVLKSNAYGHGLIPVGQFLDREVKPGMLCVDSLYEAYELSRADITTPILIMGYTNPENFRVWKKLPFIFNLYDLATARALAKYQPGAKVHLKLDTGMHRLGLLENELPSFIKEFKLIKGLTVEGVFSHLASADDPAAATFTKNQLNTFKRMVSFLESNGLTFKWKHIAATAGAETIADPYFNLLRLGLGFYGVSPFGPHTKEGRRQRQYLRPALTLTSHLAVVKELERGSKVGYGGTYTAKQNERLAILPLGYNEGISRALSNRGVVTLNEIPCPVIGRVSMNMTAIKLTRNTKAQVGDLVTVISPDASVPNSLYQLALAEGTIPYEVLTSLHPSIRRSVV